MRDSPEVALLLCCVGTPRDVQRAEQIQFLLHEKIDWTYLTQTAPQHGVIPVLYRSLHSTYPDAVPEVILEQLRNHFYANAGRNLFLRKQLCNLLHLLETHEIPAIPYKGPVLAVSVYENLAFREFGDLDILVHERDYQTAQHLLSAQGYRLMKEFDWESTFVHNSGRVVVDLHRRMTEYGFRCPLNFDYLSKRLKPAVLAGTTVPNLSPEDTLLMLAIQITKDAGSRYFQLAKICDMAELLRAYPRLDFAQALRQAKRLGGERMLLYSLRLANNLLDTVLPQEVISEMRFHPAIEGLVECARRQLFDGYDRADQPTVDQFRWLVRERLRDKLYPYSLRYVTDVIVPCELDRRLLPLPGRLSFLYYFIRPVRLVRKYVLLLLKRVIRYPRDYELST